MKELLVYRYVFLFLMFYTHIQSQKILSEKKKCGDPQCESLMMRAQANQDYNGPDCRFLSFKSGDEINVYYKLSGKREDLWQGSKGKSYGFFPKDTVNIEEVFLKEEVEVFAQEIDFICLDGGEYVFENEDSVLHKPKENEYSDIYLERTDHEIVGKQDQEIKGNAQVEATLQASEHNVAESDLDKSTWTVSGIGSWFGIGKTEDKEAAKTAEEPLKEDTFLGRKITVTEETGFEDAGDEQPEENGWFSGRFTQFLPFGAKESEIEKNSDSLKRSSNIEIDAVGQENYASEKEESILEAKHEPKDQDDSQAKWFNFGFKNMLGFGDKNKDKQDFHETSEETIKTKSPDDVPLNRNAQGEKTDVFGTDSEQPDKLKEITDAKQEVNPENISLNKTTEKGKEDSLFDHETTATNTHRADKETLDLSLEHRDIHEQKSYTKSEKPSASSFLSFSDVVLFWETTCSKVVAVYTKLETPDLSPLIAMIHKVASYLPEDMQPGSHFYGHPWDVVIFTVVLGFFILLLFTCRAVKAIKSRGYARRESKYVAKVAELLDNKSEVLKKLSIVKKEYDELQLSLQDSGHQKLLSEISDQKTLQENLESTNLDLEENIRRLEHAFEEEKRFSSELDDELAEMNATIRTLEEEINNGSSQKEEIRTTLKVFEINQERIETSLQDNIEENIQLQESIKQLSNEDEGWEERFSELSENSKMLSSSVDEMREDLTNKQSQIKLLIDSLLKMKDWSSVLDEVDESDDSSVPSINMDFENGEPLGDPQKRTIKKLIVAAMLNASLRTVETEKKQLYDNLTDEMKAKQQLFECIENLQNTKHSLSLEKEKLGSEVEELKQKMNVMSEKHEESETKLHRKLTVQEKQRVQKEEKLSKVDEKFSLAAEELLAIKTRVKELEEEMEKTVCSYRNQVSSYEKKSHDNWLSARAAERYLSEAKKETARLRQKLTEADYKLNLLEKDPYALDVIHAIGRENSPFGPSPVGRIQDNRTFLSPPTLMEGPPRHSPMIPGADGGMRPPGYYPGYPGTKEQMDIIADRKTDHHRTLSDSGSLSPPWERNQKINFPPSGLSYQEHPFPPRRPERFYQYPAPSGRFSGPAELTRNQGKPFMDEPEGRSSPEYKARVNTSRNGSEENETLPSQPYLNEGQTVDGQQVFHGVLPPPQMRIPLLPMEPRGPYFRRPFPIPPPRMDMFRPQDYPGFPPILGPLRGPNPLHHYPPQMHRDPFFPPHHLRPPPPRSEYPPHPITQPPGDDNDKLPEPKT